MMLRGVRDDGVFVGGVVLFLGEGFHWQRGGWRQGDLKGKGSATKEKRVGKTYNCGDDTLQYTEYVPTIL